jgi:bifunctional DNA-binding transcriptional regulator/antitoxin component of YhaV-PrlF toxin-antitoxin module
MVKNKYQIVIPRRVRDEIHVAVGDVFDARAVKGSIVLKPKSAIDRAIAEGLEDVRRGRVLGPFKTVDDMLVSLKSSPKGTRKPLRGRRSGNTRSDPAGITKRRLAS